MSKRLLASLKTLAAAGAAAMLTAAVRFSRRQAAAGTARG